VVFHLKSQPAMKSFFYDIEKAANEGKMPINIFMFPCFCGKESKKLPNKVKMINILQGKPRNLNAALASF